MVFDGLLSATLVLLGGGVDSSGAFGTAAGGRTSRLVGEGL